jgi:hypothetical protein
MLLAASAVHAVNVPITARKFVVVDKLSTSGKAKVVFLAEDSAIAKGAGTDVAQIQAELDVLYDSAHGAFVMPQGGTELGNSWLANDPSLAKYFYPSAPAGGSVRIAVIKPAKLVKVVAKSLGDSPLNVSAAPLGAVYVSYTITNEGQTTRLCTQFTGCVHQTIAMGTGHKLVCRDNSTGDPTCAAATPPQTCSELGSDCGGCAFGCVADALSSDLTCVDPTNCDSLTYGCPNSTYCSVPGQTCIDIPPIAGGGTICCSPCLGP